MKCGKLSVKILLTSVIIIIVIMFSQSREITVVGDADSSATFATFNLQADSMSGESQPSLVSAEPYEPGVDEVVASVSAYSSTPDQTWGNPWITASGQRVEKGTLACPARYEFGTKVEILGQIYECQDRMNIRYRHGNYFDIWMESRAEALEFGRQTLKVKVYERERYSQFDNRVPNAEKDISLATK